MTKPTKPASKSKIDDEMIERILSYVRKGNFVSIACKACGITGSAWTQLCQRRPEIKEATEQAYAKAECDALARILEAGHDDDPRYLQWFLERRAPERFAPISRLQIEKLQTEIEKLKNELGVRKSNGAADQRDRGT